MEVGSSWTKSCFYEKFEDTKGVIRSNKFYIVAVSIIGGGNRSTWRKGLFGI
jgi:hypothetical protein